MLLAVLMLVGLTWVNAQGVRGGKLISNVFGTTKLVAAADYVWFGAGHQSGSRQRQL